MSPPRPDIRHDGPAAIALVVLGVAYFLSLDLWTRPLLLDAATWDYMAVETARGLVPYRDVFLHKTPGAALLGAVGARLGMAAGVEPVFAAHAVFQLLGALGPLLLYFLCRTRLDRAASFSAAVALLAWDEWVISAFEGCSPKVGTVMLGMGAMLAAERGRAVVASLLGGASVLFWQPGLAFLLGAWATLLARGPVRLSGIVKWGLVSLLPSALLLAWLAAHGAFVDFFEQAVLFNLDYIQSKARTFSGTLFALWRTLREWNDLEVLLAPVALLGLWATRPHREAGPKGFAARLGGRFPLSLITSGIIYAGMTFVSFQSWPDIILLGPLVAALLGVGLQSLLATRMPATLAATFACLVFGLAAVAETRPKYHPGMTFETQRTKFRALAEGLETNDRVVAVSVPEFFLHTGRRNGWKWPYLWFGVDDFAAGRHENGFEGVLDDLEADPPRLILVARLWSGPQRSRFEQWASTRYEVKTVKVFPHLRKPMRVYRRRSAEPDVVLP